MKKLWKKLFLCVAMFTLTTLTYTHWSANFVNQQRAQEDAFLGVTDTGNDPHVELVHRVASDVKQRIATEVQQLTRQLAFASVNKNDYVEDDDFAAYVEVETAGRSLSVHSDSSLDRKESLTERDSVGAERNEPERVAAMHDVDQRLNSSEFHEKNDNKPIIVEDQLKTQQRRLQHVAHACSVLGTNELSYEPDWKEMYVDDRKQYVYCLVSKASCTSWKRTLLLLTGEVDRIKFRRPEQLPVGFVHNHDISDKYIKRFVHYKQKNESNYRLEKYFKFLFVREPFERLVSAYRDKILKDPAYHVRDEIVRLYRPSSSTAGSSAARSTGAMSAADAATVSSTAAPLVQPTFTEFVRYVLDQRAAGKLLDRHWVPQNELCRPCRIKYDFVGHQETLQSDAATILRRLKTVGRRHRSNYTFEDVQFPADHVSAHSVDHVQRLFAELPVRYVDGLMQLYAVDFAMFDFQPPFVVANKKSAEEIVQQYAEEDIKGR